MTKKLAIVIHRVTDEVICTNSKTDLATILGISFSTVVRNYSNVGKYESGVYTIYIGVEMYKNNKDKNYKRNVQPPTVKTYNDTQRTITTNKPINMNVSNHISIQPIIENEPIEKEWFDIEKELLFSELRTYYIKRTEEQLRDSYDYFIKRPRNNQRIDIINECAKIKQLE